MMSKKILIIQTAFLGDAILTLPLIQKAAEKYPASQIDVVSIPSTEIIFRSSPFVNNVIVLDKKGKHRSLFKLFGFASEIKKQKYDLLLSPHRSFRTSLIVLFSGIKNTVGFDKSSFSFVYKNKVKYNYKFHEVRRNLSLLNNGIDEWKIFPQINITEEVKFKVKDIIAKNNNRQIICIAPGSVWKTKMYPQEYYHSIIEFLVKKNFYVYLIGGKEDEVLCSNLKKNFSENVAVTAGNFNPIETIELLKNSKLLICNDSAPTHMGVTANIPVLTLYCSTIKDFGFYPYNNSSSWLSFDDLKCKPCGIHGREKCPVSTFACGYNLTPAIVIQRILQMLNL